MANDDNSNDNTQPSWEDTKKDFLRKFDEKFPPVDAVVRKSEIGGLESVLSQLDRFRYGIENPQLYQYLGVTPPNGVIFHGPAGYGKTYIAKYLATELKARFVDLPLNTFESKWVGEAEKTLAKYLDACHIYHTVFDQKVFVFMDEAEEALKDRRLDGWHGPRVNLLLRYMDGFEKKEGIIYGAATNYLEKVDPAFLRSGRLDYKIEIANYDASQLGDVVRATMVRTNRVASPNHPVRLSREEYEEIGRLAVGYGLSPSDISEAFRRAGEEKVIELLNNKNTIYTPKMASFGAIEITAQLQGLRQKQKRTNIGFGRN